MVIKKEGEHLQSTIGERIKEERLKKGWTQTQLGEIVGCSAAAIMRYEKGERKSIPYKAIIENGYLIKNGYVPRLDYIKIVEKLYRIS